ncbi:MAG: sensor histidine kinase [Halapricum sp.]
MTVSLPPSSTVVAKPDALAEAFEFRLVNSNEHAGENVTIDVDLLEERFYVADDGVGIPDGLKSDLFEVRYVDAAEDTGYGLYVISAIVEAHDGEIVATDSDAGGARFEITGVEFPEDS